MECVRCVDTLFSSISSLAVFAFCLIIIIITINNMISCSSSKKRFSFQCSMIIISWWSTSFQFLQTDVYIVQCFFFPILLVESNKTIYAWSNLSYIYFPLGLLDHLFRWFCTHSTRISFEWTNPSTLNTMLYFYQ